MGGRVAICSSLQGSPEEFSPGTPVDCYRLSHYIADRLSFLTETRCFSRDDGYTGDAYIALRNDVVAWGADVAVHIHQDAGGSARGWHVIYHNQEAIPLAQTLVGHLSALPSPERYGGVVYRGDVAAVKVPPVSVLIECGFYTSAEDEAIGVSGWGDAIVKGIKAYLGIETEEEEEMPRFEKLRDYVYNCAKIKGGDTIYIHCEDAANQNLTFYGIPYSGLTLKETKGVGGWDNTVKGGNYKVSDIFPGFTEGRITIHSPVALGIEVE